MIKQFSLTIFLLLFSTLAIAQGAEKNSSVPPVMPVLEADSNAAPTAKDQSANDQEDDEAAFAAIEGETQKKPEVKDPFSGYNHVMFDINDFLDRNVATPLGELYLKIMPRPLERIVNNFYVNIDTIPTIGNDVLQANFYQAASDSWRLMINSTAGIGGAFDLASRMGLEKNYQTFGLTLARWGWTQSSYLILPVLGPDTVRGAIGRLPNYYMTIYPHIHDPFNRNMLYAGHLFNDRVQLLQYQNVADQAAIDPYVFMRNAYLQRQAYLIQQNRERSNPHTAEDMRRNHNPFYLYQ